MKYLFAFIILFAAMPAQAGNVLYLHCQRFPSKCAGQKCFEIARALKEEDENREFFSKQRLENADYEIRDNEATGTLDNVAAFAELSNGKYIVRFKHVFQNTGNITMEHRNEAGETKERVIIDKFTGFFAKYLIHTDGSLKDVPIGEPYSALFGWCEDTTDKH